VVLYAPDEATRELFAFALRADGHALRCTRDVFELFGWLCDATQPDEGDPVTILVVAADRVDAVLAAICRHCMNSGRIGVVNLTRDPDADASDTLFDARCALRDPPDVDGLRDTVNDLASRLSARKTPAAAFCKSARSHGSASGERGERSQRS
jgi:hypothetical protein